MKKQSNKNRNMRDELITIKVNPEERELLKRAAKNLGAETGKKGSVSAAVRHSVSNYIQTDFTKPECFFCDRIAIRQLDQNISYCLENLNRFLSEFKTLIGGEQLTFEELQTIFQAVGKLGSEVRIQAAISEAVRQKLYERLVRNRPDMTISMDNVPTKDLSGLFEVADLIDSAPEVRNRVFVYWYCFQYDGSENKLSILDDQVEKVKDTFRYYATTPSEIQKLGKVRKACQALNDLIADRDLIPGKVFNLFQFDSDSRQFAPSGSYIKYNEPQI
jgi:hypothetical protein